VNYRDGYRQRWWDTWAGPIELAIPKLRAGSYFPGWLLQRRSRAEQALSSVVATSYLLGVSMRRAEQTTNGPKPAATWAPTSSSKSPPSPVPGPPPARRSMPSNRSAPNINHGSSRCRRLHQDHGRDPTRPGRGRPLRA
jgi:Transposase, Mutator family